MTRPQALFLLRFEAPRRQNFVSSKEEFDAVLPYFGSEANSISEDSSMEKVRVGVIGTGGMAQGHIRRLLEKPEVALTALCDTNPDALARTRERHPGLADAADFSDYKALLASGLVDAVQIVTPHTLHYEMILDSLDAGLHVFSEKPMVCSAEHAHGVLDKIEKADKVFALGYQRYYMPEFLYIKEKIASGEMGAVQFVQGLQGQEWLRACANSWRHTQELGGGGQLNDSGSHMLAILLFITGLSVEKVVAFIDNFTVPVDINSAISVKFKGGALGNVSIVGNGPSWYEDITIWCEKGAFYMRNGKLEVSDATGKRTVPTADELPQGTSPDDNFIAAILGQEEVGATAQWGLRVIEWTESAWKSAAEDRIVTA